MALLWHSALSGMAAVALSCAAAVATYLAMTLQLLARNALSPAAAGIAVAAGTQDPGGPPAGLTGARPGVARLSLAALIIYGLLALILSSDTLIAKHYPPTTRPSDAGFRLPADRLLRRLVAVRRRLSASPGTTTAHQQQEVDSRCRCPGSRDDGGHRGGLRPGARLGGHTALWRRYRAVERYMPWMAAVYGLYALGYLVATYLLADAGALSPC